MPARNAIWATWLALAASACAPAPAPGGFGGGGGFRQPGVGSDAGSSADAGTAQAPSGGFKPTGAAESGGAVGSGSAKLPPKPDPSALFLEAMEECAAVQDQTEKDLAAACQPAAGHEATLAWASQWHNYLIAVDERLPGLDWPSVAVAPSAFAPKPGVVQQLECSNNPSGAEVLNAFAIQHGIWMVDGLLDAFAEGAVRLGQLKAQLGDAPTDEQFGNLILEIGALFKAHGDGKPWQFVAKDQVAATLASDAKALERYYGAAAFVYFHEMAHANLSHGLIKHTITTGIGKLLKARGLKPSDQELEALALEVYQLNRSTEAQADIYAATMLKSAGFGTSGPMLFVLGFLGMNAQACIDKGMQGQELQDCMFAKGKIASHPPLDERALIVAKILGDGVDLTGELVPTALATLRQKSCGDGLCQATESKAACPADCGT